MAKKTAPKIRERDDLNAATAENVFGWKNIQRHAGHWIGKKQDKAGRWRKGKVPPYASDPIHACAIDERMRQLDRWDRYERELSRITKRSNLPRDWATPEQKSRAAIKAIRK